MRRLHARVPSLRLALFALFALFAFACAQQPPPGAAGPVEAVQDFSAALAKGDSGAAWARLSARTQQEADALARAAHAAGAAQETGRQMLFTSAVPLGAVQARRIAGDANTAQVETSGEDGGAKATWQLVLEGGVWKLELALSAAH